MMQLTLIFCKSCMILVLDDGFPLLNFHVPLLTQIKSVKWWLHCDMIYDQVYSRICLAKHYHLLLL